jgi:PAS domain S-box-containing protein
MKSSVSAGRDVERATLPHLHGHGNGAAAEYAHSCGEHFVQFYDKDEFLVESVGAYVGAGLGAGEGAIVIATPEHREALATQLRKQGIDLIVVESRGQYVPLDAREILSKFMVDDWPDETLFQKFIGSLVGETAQAHQGVRAFGEMVALLWADGKGEAAIRLEELWNNLGKVHSFSLFCAYPINGFAHSENEEPFQRICQTHSRVVPAESYAAQQRNEDERARTIASLQQKAAALEAEIEERKAVQKELARRERELRDFLENANQAIHQVDADGIILWANQAELDLLGYQPEEYIGHSITEFHADEQVIEDILSRLKRDEKLFDYEARLKSRDGSIRYVTINSTPYLEDGKFVHTKCFTRDITARRQAEQAMRENEGILRAVIDNSTALIYIKDCEGKYLLINARCAELFQIPQDAFIGKTDFDLFPKEIAQSFRDNDLAVLHRGEPIDLEETTPHEDGLHTYFSTKFPLRKPDGTIYAVAGISTDITDRKRAQVSMGRLAAIVESSDDAIVSKDLNSIITSWNRGAELLFGYKAHEVIGQPITILMPPDRVNEEPGILQRIRSGQLIDHYETIRRRKDGTHVNVSLTVSPIKDAAGNVVGASKIARDITDKIRAREELERTVAERTAQLRDTVAELEAFSYSIAHDMRAPLRAMNTYSRFLEEDFAGQLPGKGKDYLHRIASGASRLDALIQDVLNYSKIARAEMTLESVDIEKLTREIIDSYPDLRDSNAIILVQSPLPQVIGNPAALTQCISNLLSNAVKFVPPNTVPRVLVRGENAGEFVRIWVEDNGIGISPEGQSRIFHMFQRLNPANEFEGTGIGLTIVRKAIGRMGGKLGVESQLGAGSRFWFELKRAA